MAKKRPRKWMSKAFGKHPGRFTRKAHRAGKSVSEYAKEKENAPGALGKEARLAEIGKRYGGGRHKRRIARRGSRRR